MMLVQELLNIIGNVGFPIAVSAYLLIRVEGRLIQLGSAINELREAVISLRWASGYVPPQGTVDQSGHPPPA
jgi:hypothetical protein